MYNKAMKEESKIVLCRSCLDDGFVCRIAGKEDRLCLECFRELTQGKLPDVSVTDSKPGKGPGAADGESPSQQNAIRAMEGD